MINVLFFKRSGVIMRFFFFKHSGVIVCFLFFKQNVLIFILLIHKNIICGCSLEAHPYSASNQCSLKPFKGN